jgi:pyrroline-5-carboxylate reductase
MTDRLLIVGCGKMGSALLDGWLEQGRDPHSIHIIEPSPDLREDLLGKGVSVHASPASLPAGFRPHVVLLAVKPQVMDDVVPAYKPFVDAETTFLSIAAGKTVGYFENLLGPGAAIVRTMPNTPAAVGRGITVAIANDAVTDGQKALCQGLLEAVGEAVWIDDEALMDGVVAVSGSGPAYVFYLTEAMARAGIEAGLPGELAGKLARATVCGAGQLQYLSSEDPATLRENVTSPGGTTAAALGVLMADDGLQDVMTRAIAAAARRSKELA